MDRQVLRQLLKILLCPVLITWLTLFMRMSDGTMFAVIAVSYFLSALACFRVLQRPRQLKFRTQALEEFARNHGYAFSAEAHDLIAPPPNKYRVKEDFENIFLEGENNRISNVITIDKTDFRFNICDHSFLRTDIEDNVEYGSRSVAVLFSPELRIPNFSLTEKNISQRIQALFESHKIQIPNEDEFNRRFVLYGLEKPAITKIFSGEVLNFLNAHPWFAIKRNNNLLYAYLRAQLISPIQLKAFVEEVEQLFRYFIKKDEELFGSR